MMTITGASVSMSVIVFSEETPCPDQVSEHLSSQIREE